jgi:hypothetical protein
VRVPVARQRARPKGTEGGARGLVDDDAWSNEPQSKSTPTTTTPARRPVQFKKEGEVPTGPVGPRAPSGPLSPVGPAGPSGPWRPVGPMGPSGPANPSVVLFDEMIDETVDAVLLVTYPVVLLPRPRVATTTTTTTLTQQPQQLQQLQHTNHKNHNDHNNPNTTTTTTATHQPQPQQLQQP